MLKPNGKRMRNIKIFTRSLLVFLLIGYNVVSSFSQRVGAITRGSVSKHIPVSNGPQGPIHGGESAVTDMILMNNAWVYGSTKATWGGLNCSGTNFNK